MGFCKGTVAAIALAMLAISGVAQAAPASPAVNVVNPSMKLNIRQGVRVGAPRKDESKLAPLLLGLLAVAAAGAAAGVAVAVSNNDSPASP